MKNMKNFDSFQKLNKIAGNKSERNPSSLNLPLQHKINFETGRQKHLLHNLAEIIGKSKKQNQKDKVDIGILERLQQQNSESKLDSVGYPQNADMNTNTKGYG